MSNWSRACTNRTLGGLDGLAEANLIANLRRASDRAAQLLAKSGATSPGPTDTAPSA